MIEKINKLETEPIGKLLATFSIPAVVAMMVNAIYNVVDRIFIGQYVGEAALAGLTIVFPVMMLFFAFAGLIGQGGTSLVSIKLGAKDSEGANYIFSNMLILSTTISIVVALLMMSNLEAILNFFGSDSNTLPHAYGYMRIILVGIIFQLTAFGLSGIVRADGQPMLSMASMMLSALTNIVLDYLFIAKFGWGAQGAALATIIGQFTGLIVLAQYFLRGKSSLKVRIKYLKLNLEIVKQILTVGATTFLSTIGTSAAMLALNKSLSEYGGMAAITSMGAINSLFTLFIMPIFGIQQGMQPIIGYNHGSGNYDRVKKTLVYGIGMGVLFSTTVFIVLQIYPVALMSMFLDPSSETMVIGVHGLKIFTLALPILSINLLGTSYFQSIAAGKKALLLGASRQFILLIPLVMILPNFLGLEGVWYATPISDFLAVTLTVVMLIPAIQKSSKEDRGFVQEKSLEVAFAKDIA